LSQGKKLSYYGSDKKKECKGVINLEGAKVIEADALGGPEFVIITNDNIEYEIVAENYQIKSEWMEALTKEIKAGVFS